MRALVVCSRNPWPSYTGDRLRTTIWLDALRPVADVTLIAPSTAKPPAGLAFYGARPTPALMPLQIASAFVRRLPLQTALPASHDWRHAIDRAARERGPFDTTIVLLSRFEPAVRDQLTGRTVLDAIDSLRRSMGERARAARNPIQRAIWSSEQRGFARLEATAAARYDEIVVTSDEDAAEFGGKTTVLPLGVRLQPPGSEEARRTDFGFWGRLAYFANEDAVRLLLREIWPAIRNLHPAATLAIGGADASAAIREADGRDGVRVVSPVDDMPAFARGVKIALFPVRFGTGVATKVLEAAEAGCAIVATPVALRGADPIAKHSILSEDPGALAAECAGLLRDAEKRRALASAVRAAVEEHYDRARIEAAMRRIAFGAEVSP